MSTMMSFNSNGISNSMTMDEVKRMCPAAFKSEPTNPNLSDKYVQANTATVIEDLGKLGWYPVQAKQCRAKKNSSGIRSFHMIAFQNPDIYIKKDGDDGGTIDAYPRIILTNSHDGFNSFKFMVGLFRLVCSNGLVVGTDEFANMAIRHINYDFETLRDVVKTTIDGIPGIICKMNEMKNTVLSEDEKKELAASVVKIRKNIPEEEKFDIDEATIMDILQPNRSEDAGDDLWTVFNICQEKMIKGGFSATNAENKTRKQRAISSIKKDMDFNQKLWDVAARFMPATVAA